MKQALYQEHIHNDLTQDSTSKYKSLLHHLQSLEPYQAILSEHLDDWYLQIRARLNKIVVSPKSHDSDAIKASDLVLRATGGLAPERHEVVAMAPEDRAARYADVLTLVRAEQTHKTPVVERTPEGDT